MKMYKKVSFMGVWCLSVFFIAVSVNSSAIPMWEYLSKQEKTSFIYSLFANQVEKFCEKSIVPFCNRQLLKYGLMHLKNMNDNELDAMDPYQRDSNNIIWESLMKGHRFEKTTQKPEENKLSTTFRPNSYEDEQFSEDFDDLGTQNVYILPPPKDFLEKLNQNQKDTEKTEKNSNNHHHHDFEIIKSTDGEGVYDRFQNQFRPISVSTEKVFTDDAKSAMINFSSNPLNGPMIIKVYPDGSPVKENSHHHHHQIMQDDDLTQYQLQHIKIPNY